MGCFQRNEKVHGNYSLEYIAWDIIDRIELILDTHSISCYNLPHTPLYKSASTGVLTQQHNTNKRNANTVDELLLCEKRCDHFSNWAWREGLFCAKPLHKPKLTWCRWHQENDKNTKIFLPRNSVSDFCLFTNLSWSAHTSVRRGTLASLVWVMVCRLFGANQLCKPPLIYVKATIMPYWTEMWNMFPFKKMLLSLLCLGSAQSYCRSFFYQQSLM